MRVQIIRISVCDRIENSGRNQIDILKYGRISDQIEQQVAVTDFRSHTGIDNMMKTGYGGIVNWGM